MGRLIEADNLKQHIIETYHDPIIVCNDDEVHFVAEIIDEYPTVEAIPKDQYENRLKADLVAMLTELQLEIAELPVHVVSNIGSIIRMETAPSAEDVYEVIQDKINALKEKKNE